MGAWGCGVTPTPATLPGLLRSCTAVIALNREHAIVIGHGVGHDGVLVYLLNAKHEAWLSPSDLTLDTDDPTSRAHLAWWILARLVAPGAGPMDRAEYDATMGAIHRACVGLPMNDRHINILVNVARHLAGLEPS